MEKIDRKNRRILVGKIPNEASLKLKTRLTKIDLTE